MIFRLKESGLETETNPYVNNSLRINSSVNPERLYGFSDGLFFVQDRASAICSALIDAKDGETIIDVCAAPGGKSFSAAINSLDRAEIHSFDIHESKLSLISSGAERLGLKSVKVAARDALYPDEALVGRADKVICDAPCSGLGVMGKKPDLRYKDIDSIEALPTLQYDILSASAKYLKKGGVIIYSTCTLNPEENECVAKKFVEEDPNFALEPFAIGDLKAECGYLTLLPNIDHTDGFFMAKIRRID